MSTISISFLETFTIPSFSKYFSIREDYSYVNTADNATRTLWMFSTMPNLTSLDPIQANDGSINQLSANVNARIINMTEDDQIMADGSLSYNYAIGEGNTAFYFILRDDCFFSKVENHKVVGTDILVGGEDVVELPIQKDETI